MNVKFAVPALAVVLLAAAATVSVKQALANTTPSPSLSANVSYVTFPPALGPYCVAGILPNRQIYIANGVGTVVLRFNAARDGYDQYIVDGVVVPVQPDGIHKLLPEPCLFVP